MKRYRRKPEYVEVQQWHEDDKPFGGMMPGSGMEAGAFYVYVAGNWTPIRDGDWHGRDADGHWMLVRAADFERLYEPVE
jgi:hypothetical protein